MKRNTALVVKGGEQMNFLKKYWKALVIGAVFGLALGILVVSFVNTPRAEATSDACIYNCPVIHYEWDTYACPSGYSNNPGHDNCRKHLSGSNYLYEDKVKTGHNADVAYNKSNDPNKCHRPSDHDLDVVYGMDTATAADFKDHNSEWKDSKKSAPEGYYINEDGKCVVSPTPTPTASPTVRPTCTPTPTPTVGPTSTPNPCDDEKGCDNSTPAPTPEPTVEPTPVDNTDHSIQLGGAPQGPACEKPLYAPTPTYLGETHDKDGNAVFSYSWTTVKDGLHSYWIEYGATKNSLPYSVVVNGESVSLTMFGASSNWMRVAGYDQGCIGSFSAVVN